MPDNKGYMTQKEAEKRIMSIHKLQCENTNYKGIRLLTEFEKALLTVVHLRRVLNRLIES